MVVPYEQNQQLFSVGRSYWFIFVIQEMSNLQHNVSIVYNRL